MSRLLPRNIVLFVDGITEVIIEHGNSIFIVSTDEDSPGIMVIERLCSKEECDIEALVKFRSKEGKLPLVADFTNLSL